MSNIIKMNFLYLLSKPNKTYLIRDEEFVIKELINANHLVTKINNFYFLKILYYLSKYKIDAIIFSSLNIGKKNIFFLKQLKKPLFWWYFDSANASRKRLKDVIRVAKNTKIFFNRDKINFSNYTKLGIKPIWLDQGAPDIINEKYNCNNFEYDVGFFGSLSSVHKSRAKLLKKIDEKFNLIIYSKDKHKFKKLGFKNVKNFVFKNQIPEAISKIKITLILNSTCSAPYYWSDRIHIMIGSGGFCLTEFIEGIDKKYLPNKHHIIFNGENDCFEKINFWLKKNEKRKIIINNGFKHAHKYHSYKSRVLEFLDYIK